MNKIMWQINGRPISLMIATLLCAIFIAAAAHAETGIKGTGENDRAQIMRAFQQQHIAAEQEKSISLKDKYRIMFMMGVTLLILILTTGGLGVAMVVYGKQVFVIHMVFAGLSMSLAVIHAIVGIVWFFPF